MPICQRNKKVKNQEGENKHNSKTEMVSRVHEGVLQIINRIQTNLKGLQPQPDTSKMTKVVRPP